MKLTVIFGAGASYDSVPHLPPRASDDGGVRLPLADSLFDQRPHFAKAMKMFPACLPIIPHLRHRPNGVTVEQALERLQAEATAHPERHSQLAAVRFYLHYAIWDCQRHWSQRSEGVTNYKTLLDQIERWRTRATNEEYVP